MSEIVGRRCDGPDCSVAIEKESPAYYTSYYIPMPGTWFRLSHGDESKEFHSADCLVAWLDQHLTDEEARTIKGRWPFRRSHA